MEHHVHIYARLHIVCKVSNNIYSIKYLIDLMKAAILLMTLSPLSGQCLRISNNNMHQIDDGTSQYVKIYLQQSFLKYKYPFQWIYMYNV